MAITRGTTPTLFYEPDVDITSANKLTIAFTQDNKLIFKKQLSDCKIEGNVVSVRLSEEETLKFSCDYLLYMQLKALIGKEVIASEEAITTIEPIKDEERLS